MKIDVDEFIQYCEKCADVSKDIHSKVMDNIGHGESAESAIGACAYFMQRETMFRYEIPHIVKDFAENETPFEEQPIEYLELSIRPYNCLKRAGVRKVSDIIRMGKDNIMTVRNLGKHGFEEIEQKVFDVVESDTEEKNANELKMKSIVKDLIELGYPHNFQLENSWVVDYCYNVSDIVKKAMELKSYLE